MNHTKNENKGDTFGPPITEEDIYTFFNKRACDIILPQKLKLILDWGCNKLPHEPFWLYISSNIQASDWSRYRKRWNKDDENKLQQTNPDGFDVTFLIKLIPEVCNNIQKCGTDAWVLDDESQIETLLRKIKNLRNDVMHEPRGAAISPNTLSEVRRLLTSLITVAGKIYHIDQNVIRNDIVKLNEMISSLKETTMTDKEKRIIQIQRKLVRDGLMEIRLKFSDHGNVMMPIGSRKVSLVDVFHHLNLIPDSELDRKQSDVIPCTSIFDKSNEGESKSFHIVEGIPGSGKSTLLRRIAQDVLKIEKNIFPGLDEYDLLLYVECRDSTIASLADLLRIMFSKTLEKIETNDAEDACKNLKKLVIIDGLDEINENSRKLLNQFISLYGNQVDNTTFVCSCRPHAASMIKNICKDKNIQYSAYKIQGIEDIEEQVTFLEKYQKTLANVDTHNLKETFRNLDNQVYRHFTTPIHLTLFCDAYQYFDGNIENWTSECGAMRETIKLCRNKMVERLDQQGVFDSNVVSKVILQSVCKISLNFLIKDMFHIDTESYDELCIEIYDRVKQKINCNEIMSCIWSPKHSFHKNTEVTYEFFHKSHQEYMAAKHIFECLLKNSRSSITKIIREDMENEVQDEDVKKFLNVFKFLTIELYEASKLSKYLPEICNLLNRTIITFSYCADVIRCCNNDSSLAKEFANIINNDDILLHENGESGRSWWTVNSNSLIPAAALILQYKLPSALEINIPSSSPLSEYYFDLVATLRKKDYIGVLNLNLWNSHDNFEPCDKFLVPFQDMRCKLWQFSGCISTEASIKTLHKIGDKGRLHTSLPHSFREHSLQLLQQNHFSLSVTVRYFEVNTLCNTLRPLPDSPKPNQMQYRDNLPSRLTITEVPHHGADTVHNIVCKMAPTDKKFYDVRLQKCSLNNGALERLLGSLVCYGIRTEGFLPSHWSNIGSSASGICFQCREVHSNASVQCLRLTLTDGSSISPNMCGKVISQNDHYFA